MLNSLSPFISELRKDRIATPMIRSFTPEKWQADFERLGTGTDAEKIVRDAGEWVGAELKRLWSDVDGMNLRGATFEGLVTSSMLFSFQLHSSVHPIVEGERLTADQIDTAVGDGLWRALSYLSSIKVEFKGTSPLNFVTIKNFLEVCRSIYCLEYFMGRVIHCGWELVHGSDGPCFRSTDADRRFAENEAIALHIREEEGLEFAVTYGRAWENGKLRHHAPAHLRLASRSSFRARFRFVDRPPDEMPLTVPLFEMEIPEWLHPLLTKIPDDTNGLSIQDLLTGWLGINQVFKLIHRRETRDDSRVNCALHIDDLLDALELLGHPRDRARKLVAFLTYEWNRHEGLWSSPLVRLGDNIYPFLPSVLNPHLSRLLDHWFKRFVITNGGKKTPLITARGDLFEDHVRRTLTNYCAEMAGFDTQVYPRSLTIRKLEIDLLWRVGSTIFVGEAKCQKFPANANDIGNYYRELEHGAEQLDLRIKALSREKGRLKDLLGWEGPPDDLTLSPLIISSHPTGAGLTYHGIPCIHFDMLEMLFYRDSFGMTVGIAGGDGPVQPTALKFEKQPDTFADFIKFYVETPAAVWFRNNAVKLERAKTLVTSGGTRVWFEDHYVDLPLDQRRLGYAAPLEAQWNALVTAATIGLSIDRASP